MRIWQRIPYFIDELFIKHNEYMKIMYFFLNLKIFKKKVCFQKVTVDLKK